MSMGITAAFAADDETPAPSYPVPPVDGTDPGNYILSDDGNNYNPTTDNEGNYVRGDAVTFSITIPKTATDKANGTDHAYAAYQIFKGDLYVETTGTTPTLSNIEWGSGVTNTTALVSALADNTTLSALGITSGMTAAQVADKLDGLAFDAEAAKEFAKVVSGFLATGSASDEDGDNYVMSGLNAGYYLVKDTNENDEFDQENYAQTRYMLEVVGNVTAQPKQSIPTIVKKVDDTNDSTDTTNTVEWADTADYDIGDSVPYQITGTLPENLADYTTYTYKITDTLSDGLTYNNDARVYFVYPGFDFWVEVNEHPNVTVSNNGQTLTVEISDVKGVTGGYHSLYDPAVESGMLGRMGRPGGFVQEVPAGTQIVVRYSATLNEDAVKGEAGNENTVVLEYSNNPNGDGTGETPGEKVIVFSYEIDVNKVERDETVDPITADEYEDLENKDGWVKDSSGKYYKTKPLAGADFTLYKLVADSTTEGAQTGAAIYAALPDQIRPLAKDVFENNTKYYVVVDNKTGTTAGSEFKFDGVDDGTYVLIESTVPAGYNGIKAKTFEVTATHTNANEEPAMELTALTVTDTSFKADKKDGTIKTDIENNSGTVLPSTGGIGTTIFYVVGSILVVAAGVLLITKKRMSREG